LSAQPPLSLGYRAPLRRRGPTLAAVRAFPVLMVTLTATVLVTLVCAVIIVVAARRAGPLQKARRQAMAAMCAQRGLVPSGANLARDFSMLPSIERTGLSNAFSSPDGGVAAADLIRSEGKSEAFFSVLSFTVAGVNMPMVSVDPRNVFTGAVLGGAPTLELESDEFDKRFVVRAKDRRSAVMLLDPGMMQWLLDCDHVSFVMSGDRVLASINRAAEPSHDPSEPVEFELLFKFWDGFLARMPAILRSEYAAVQSQP
jgi:Protein of unknown function (DUF3137)